MVYVQNKREEEPLYVLFVYAIFIVMNKHGPIKSRTLVTIAVTVLSMVRKQNRGLCTK